MVVDIRSGAGSGVVVDHSEGGFPLLRFGAHVLFVGDNGEIGGELWRTDGTAAATTPILDANPGPSDGLASSPVGNRFPSPMVARDGQFFFWVKVLATQSTGSASISGSVTARPPEAGGSAILLLRRISSPLGQRQQGVLHRQRNGPYGAVGQRRHA